jgi:hypothetical protein
MTDDTLNHCTTCNGTGIEYLPVPPRTEFFISFLNEPCDEWEPDPDRIQDCPACAGTGVAPTYVTDFLSRVADLLETSSPEIAATIRTAVAGRKAA